MRLRAGIVLAIWLAFGVVGCSDDSNGATDTGTGSVDAASQGDGGSDGSVDSVDSDGGDGGATVDAVAGLADGVEQDATTATADSAAAGTDSAATGPADASVVLDTSSVSADAMPPQADAVATADASSPMCGKEPFAAFKKSCDKVADCFVAFHQVDCCGSLTAIGLHVSEKTKFEEAEAKCVKTYPACDCPQQPTTAELGKPGDKAQMSVACKDNVCTSWSKN